MWKKGKTSLFKIFFQELFQFLVPIFASALNSFESTRVLSHPWYLKFDGKKDDCGLTGVIRLPILPGSIFGMMIQNNFKHFNILVHVHRQKLYRDLCSNDVTIGSEPRTMTPCRSVYPNGNQENLMSEHTEN